MTNKTDKVVEHVAKLEDAMALLSYVTRHKDSRQYLEVMSSVLRDIRTALMLHGNSHGCQITLRRLDRLAAGWAAKAAELHNQQTKEETE